MIKLSYKLLEEEAIRYFEMVLRTAKETRVPRFIAMTWGPALAILIVLVFKLKSSVVAWIVAVSFSLLWITVICPKIYREVCYIASKRKLAENKSVLVQMDIVEKNGILFVNGVEKKPKIYLTYFDLFVVGFDDDTNLIVPERIFNNDEAKMEQFIRNIALYIKNTKTEKNL